MVTFIKEKIKQSQPLDEEEQARAAGDGLLVFPSLPAWPPPGTKSSASALRPVFPSRFLLAALRDARLRVRAPFGVALSTENDDVIAEAPEFNEFGFGKNSSDALADLQRAITELYLTLEKEEGRLGPDLLQTWQRLQDHIAKR
ncbi:MAG: hypothetical protein HY680_05635 [Chloroflexi bacterium]|nr:hypothetical protein [Chloroflexota bacterium]